MLAYIPGFFHIHLNKIKKKKKALNFEQICYINNELEVIEVFKEEE